MLLAMIVGQATLVHPSVKVYVYPRASVIEGHATHALEVALGRRWIPHAEIAHVPGVVQILFAGSVVEHEVHNVLPSTSEPGEHV
jgi:hypothetical protein